MNKEFIGLFVESGNLHVHLFAIVHGKNADYAYTGFIHPVRELCVWHFEISIAAKGLKPVFRQERDLQTAGACV